jgi:hypothetical protein
MEDEKGNSIPMNPPQQPQLRPARAGEVWSIWTESGPMVPAEVTVDEIGRALEEVHRQHETNARRVNEMMAALKNRFGELIRQSQARAQAQADAKSISDIGAKINPAL